jgi:hypothetical protein
MPSSRGASDLHPCSFPEELSQEYAKAAAAHCPAPTGRILRIGPVSPRERVRKALAGVRIVREARLLVAEVGAAEPRSEKRPGAVVEREIPDLVRVFVLDDRPGVRAAVGCRRQQRLVEDDEAGARAPRSRSSRSEPSPSQERGPSRKSSPRAPLVPALAPPRSRLRIRTRRRRLEPSRARRAPQAQPAGLGGDGPQAWGSAVELFDPRRRPEGGRPGSPRARAADRRA